LSFKKLHAVLRLELFQLRSIWEKWSETSLTIRMVFGVRQ
jgi:hypothetical protein